MSQMRTPHTVSAFDADVEELFEKFATMHERVAQLLERAIEAVASGDEAAAAKVVEEDREIDDMQADIEHRAVRFIARRAPVADDLRFIVGLIKVIAMLERVGDHAKNISKRVAAVDIAGREAELSILRRMTRAALLLLADGVRSFRNHETPDMRSIEARDDEIDEAFDELTAALVERMCAAESDVYLGTHLLFIGKQLERVGDHGVNIARAAHYIATGAREAAA